MPVVRKFLWLVIGILFIFSVVNGSAGDTKKPADTAGSKTETKTSQNSPSWS